MQLGKSVDCSRKEISDLNAAPPLVGSVDAHTQRGYATSGLSMSRCEDGSADDAEQLSRAHAHHDSSPSDGTMYCDTCRIIAVPVVPVFDTFRKHSH